MKYSIDEVIKKSYTEGLKRANVSYDKWVKTGTLDNFKKSTNHDSTMKIAPRFDTSNVVECLGMYNNCSQLEEIPELIFPKSKDVRNLCLGCVKLKRIGAVHIPEYTYGTQIFANCSSLEEVLFVAEILKSISFQHSPLSMESVKSVVTHLKDYSGTDKEFAYAITFKNGVWTEFKATECDMEGYDSWEAYVAGIGWNVEEV